METVKRIKWLDLARSFAILSITSNHAVNRSFATLHNQYAEFNSMPLYLSVIKVIILAFSKLGVPIFLMITGHLMLQRNYEKPDTIKRFLKHNWMPLLITTEIWLAIMFWYLQLWPDSALHTHGIKYTLVRFVMTQLFLNPTTMGSMWYMEMILCAYLIIPILSIALKKIDNKYFIIPMLIVIISSFILPDANGFLASRGISNLHGALETANVFSLYAVYMLFGYFIAHNGLLDKMKTSRLIAASILSFAVFCAFQIYFYKKPLDFEVARHNSGIFNLVCAIFLFELFRRAKIGDGFGKILEGLSKISFGIYFVHICIMAGLNAAMHRFAPGILYLPKFFVLELVSFFGAILIISVLKHIKVFRERFFIIK